MNTVIKLKLPLYYVATKTKTIRYGLNAFLMPLGVKKFVNAYYLNQAKKKLQKEVESQIKDIGILDPELQYISYLTLFRADNRRQDIDNLAIYYKFAHDIIKKVHLPDDHWKYIPMNVLFDGGVLTSDPHVIIELIGYSPEEYASILEKIECKFR